MQGKEIDCIINVVGAAAMARYARLSAPELIHEYEQGLPIRQQGLPKAASWVSCSERPFPVLQVGDAAPAKDFLADAANGRKVRKAAPPYAWWTIPLCRVR